MAPFEETTTPELESSEELPKDDIQIQEDLSENILEENEVDNEEEETNDEASVVEELAKEKTI